MSALNAQKRNVNQVGLTHVMRLPFFACVELVYSTLTALAFG